ncbi:zona pellucida sperm-binding protein 3-like [Nothobranchius furzeri]|uniref:Zona pellucida sperm-binding protein 3-like n=1 Tax=Nothobranchius furzeri TaxID=105023 RepID=A0A9D3BUQ9_NOTFU|nr:zona pellucida sperm-binding protein 3-like [Nothobranchius furzeri]KAF7219293.1 zona pellucida sperm-binding protein 3-like [Nothobranchius furzeri]
MESSQVIVFSFVLVLVGLSDSRLPSMRPAAHWAAVMHSPGEVQVRSAAGGPERKHFSVFMKPANRFLSKQVQSKGDEFKWTFPEDSVSPVTPAIEPLVPFNVLQPAVSSRVAVRCGESRIQVEVSQDLLGLGRLIHPDDITLGGCPPTEMDPSSNVLIFESELHDCGSTLEVYESGFVYAYKLVYEPRMLDSSPITRSQRTVIRVECHYAN